jgi:long-chain acyl-CoA synthetase
MPDQPHRDAAQPSPLALLARAAALAPQAPALHCGALRLSYTGYARAVSALAAQFAAADAAGTPVVLLLRNSMALPVAIFAAQAAGGSAVALNPDYTVRELADMLAIAAPRLVVTHGDLAATLHAALPADFAGTLLALPDDEASWLAGLVASGDGQLALPDPDAIGVIQFTGGTTGRAKGVMLSHRALAANVAQREAVLPTGWLAERVICMMPLFHSFASAMGLLLCANAAGCLSILPRYRPDWVVDTIRAEAITLLPAGPTVFNSLLGYDGLSRAALASVRAACSGSAPLSQATLARWEAATGIPIYEGYGQSEAGPVLTYHGPDRPLKLGSVGPALPDTRIIIADPATGAVLPAGQSGEVRAQGPQVMAGYLHDPEATAQTLAGGWLHTGDIGRLDDDGWLFIEDRLKDMVISGGFNIYPREIDEVMLACPGITEAAAIGVPDDYRGEIVWAFHAGPCDSETLAAWLAGQLVKYKRPARLVAVDALPRTPVGKVDKPALRALAAAMRETVPA